MTSKTATISGKKKSKKKRLAMSGKSGHGRFSAKEWF